MDTPSPRPSRTPSSINLNRLDLEKNTPDSTLPSSSASSTRNSKSEKNKDGAHSGLEAVVVDDVFTADIDGDGPDYRGVAWPGAFVLLLKSQVGESPLVSFPFLSLDLLFLRWSSLLERQDCRGISVQEEDSSWEFDELPSAQALR